MACTTSHAGKSETVAVVLVNFNGTGDTLKCLDSLRAIGPERFPTIVVENGSTPDRSGEIAQAHPWVTVIRREDNGGWAGGNNTGIRHALEHGADHVLLLNNDTTVAPDLIERLLCASAKYPDYGILGPLICSMDEPDVVMTEGCRFNAPGGDGFFTLVPVPVFRSDPPRVSPVDIVNGCCMMIATRVFERIGLIDERFFLIHEESDFCLRAIEAGYRCGVLAEPLVWHKGSSTFKRTGQSLQRYFDSRNFYLLLSKHRATQRNGRKRLPSWFSYYKLVHYYHSAERELENHEAADAVLNGLADALARRYGPRPRVRSPLVPLLRLVFESARIVSRLKPKRRASAHAISVR
jgi:GT2 family glycosyltransferase